MYDIDAIRYTPRAASGNVDDTLTMHVWIAESDFGVNVANAGETAAFWASNSGNSDLAVLNFPTANVVDHALDSGTTRGSYILARFTGTSGGAFENSNLGGSYFQIDGNEVAPEPETAGLLAIALGIVLVVRKRTVKPE